MQVIGTVSDPNHAETLKEIKEKFSEAKKELKEWKPKMRKLDVSSTTETCPGIDGTIRLGKW